MANLLLRCALCVTLALCAGSAAFGGELDRQEETAVRGRESKFRVHPPTPEAKLFFEDVLIQGMGAERTFCSPALTEGKRYAYKVVAVWVENGREVAHEMRVAFWAGDDVVLDFRR